jgi:TonB-dependent SusC/RagA subfamily outer membrane receptor
MKLRANSAITLVSIIFCAFTYLNQGDISDKIIRLLTQHTLKVPQEKVYLHFDKPYYMSGETMWFKGYLFNAVSHSIDSVSRVLYVDLVDPAKGKVLIHNILRCENGMTDGSFILPDSLAEKVYTVRAYTNYMKNFSEDWFFQKDVKIWQTSGKSKTDFEGTNEIADCAFFPEGGYAVCGLEGRMAFKAVNKMGKGLDIQGYVLENETDTVIGFKSMHAGMGYFNFTPQLGKKYAVVLSTIDTLAASKNDNTTHKRTFILPDAKANGVALIVDNVTNRQNIKVFVKNTQPQPIDKAGEYTIVAHQRGNPCFLVKCKNTEKVVALNILRTIIPDDGIVQITLFDTEGQPLCERLVFVQKNNQINLKVTPDKASYQPREKVTLNIEATDSTGKPVMGNFSLSATDGAQVLQEKYAENMMSYLLLSSDLNGKDAILRGAVENPAYYFDKSNKAVSRDLDVLMMTQGWRRFVWKDILTENFIKPQFLVEQGLSVTGKAIRPNGQVSKQPISVTMFISEGKRKKIEIAQADSTGTFVFYNLNFEDTTSVFVKAVKDKGLGGLKIKLDKPYIPKVLINQSPYSWSPYDENAFANFLKNARETIAFEQMLRRSQEKMLETVEITAKRKVQSDDRRLYEKPSNSIDMRQENCGGYTNILDFLSGRIAGVQVSESGFERQVRMRGGSNVYFKLDGNDVDIDFISSISPCDVEAIDVLKGPEAAIFGSRGGDGVIAILTKRGNPNYDFSNDDNYLPANVVIQKLIGYTPVREFYAPKYDVPKPEHEFKDFRSTLHWQPYIKTDSNGKATVSFWNTDAKSNVNVTVEGISQTGRMGVASCSYKVN